MRHFWRHAALCCALLFARAASLPPAALPRPNYLAFAREQLPLVDAQFQESSCYSHGRVTTPCNAAVKLAALHATYWNLTGDLTYVPRASSLMLLYVRTWANVTSNGTQPNPDTYDFFAGAPLAIAMKGLVRVAGGLDGWAAVDVSNVRRAMQDECSPEMRGPWCVGGASRGCPPSLTAPPCCPRRNQAMSRAVGTAIAIDVFPELDAGGSWSEYAASVWSDWTSAHGYSENSPVYNSIFFVELFSLGRALSPAIADADARSAPSLAFCAHYRDLIATSGFISSFGDNWSNAGVNISTWGPAEMAYFWASAFERCATAAAQAAGSGGPDPASLSWAAAASFFSATGGWQGGIGGSAACGAAGLPLGPIQPPDADDLRRVLNAESWRQEQSPTLSPAASVPFSTALVTRRKQPVGDAVPDKLILTPDRTPGSGAPYAVSDLWHSSVLYHTHIQQVGALTFFASNGTTFLRHTGRDNTLPEAAATSMIIWRDVTNITAFPFRAPENFIHPGTWVLAELPTSHMSPWPTMAPADFYRRNLSALHFFFANELQGGGTIDLSLAYIHLFSPVTGAVLVIDDFSDVDYAWPNATIAHEAGAPGPTQQVLTIKCGAGLSNNTRPASVKRPLNHVFDAHDDFQLLRFFWRVGANAPRNSTALLTVTTGPYSIPEGDYATHPVIGSCYDWGSVGYGAGTNYAIVSPRGALQVAELLYPSFAPNVSAAFAAPLSPAGDSLGGFTVRGHFSSGIMWERRIVLLREGALLAFDALAVERGDPADVEAWRGGPSYNLQLLHGLDDLDRVAGYSNVYDARGFNGTGCYGNGAVGESPDHLLVALFATSGAHASGAVGGAASAWLVGNVHVATPFIHAALSSSGGPMRFVTLLLPHGGGAGEAPVLAAAVTVSREGGDATVVELALPAGRGAATVTLSDDAQTWSVVRK